MGKLRRYCLAALVLLAVTSFHNVFALPDSNVPKTGIGAIYGLTGPLADFSTEFKNGASLFLEQHPAAPLKIIFEDSRWDPKIAVSAFEKLTNVDRVRIVHVMGSGTSLAIKPISERKGVLLFSAGAHPDLLKESRLVIRHANLASRDAKVLADAVAAANPKTIATIYIENEWGNTFDKLFRADLARVLSFSDVVSEPHDPGEADFKAHIIKLLRSKPDVVVVNSSGAAAGMIIRQITGLGFRGKIFANNGLALSADAQTILRNSQITGFQFLGYPPVNDSFRQAYRRRFGTDPGYFAQASYIDYELLSQAIAQVGPGTAEIAEYIKKLGTFKGTYESMTISANGDISIETSMQVFK